MINPTLYETNMYTVTQQATKLTPASSETTNHHDLLMHNLESLASFSETGRRPNGIGGMFILFTIRITTRLGTIHFE